MSEINCLGDSLTGAFVVHLRHLATNIAFICNTEEKTIKIIQNKATFPFILTLWAYGCTEFISAIAFLFKQFSLWPVIISSVIRKNSFMNSWKPTDYGKVSLLNSYYNLLIQTFSLSPTSRWKLNTKVSIWFVPVFVTPFELWAVSNDIMKAKINTFALFFCHLILTPIAQDMIMKLQTLVICDRHQFF